MKVRDVIYVLIASVVLRGFAEILVNAYLDVDAYYVSLTCQFGMYALIFGVLARASMKGNIRIRELFGSPRFSYWWAALIFWPAMILMFSWGENAIEILIVSSVDKHAAYSFFNMHIDSARTYPFFSLRVLTFVFITSLVAPIVEEYVFRGLLLRGLSRRWGVVAGIVTSSFIFTLFHFSHPEYMSTFVFSVFVSVLYLRYSSLILSILVHGSFNLMAFIGQYYFDHQWTRSIDHISNISDWWVQIVMLVISLPLLLYFIFHSRDGLAFQRSATG